MYYFFVWLDNSYGTVNCQREKLRAIDRLSVDAPELGLKINTGKPFFQCRAVI